MWWGMVLFKIGSGIGTLISTGMKLKKVFDMAKNIPQATLIKWGVIILFLVSTIGFGYWQYQRAERYDAKVDTLQSQLKERDRIIEDTKKALKEKEEIITDLDEVSRAREIELNKLNKRIRAILGNLDSLTDDEASKVIGDSIENSYNCIMVASGNNSVTCNE